MSLVHGVIAPTFAGSTETTAEHLTMLQLVVTVPSVEAELASHMLWGLGVVAIEERDAADASGGGSDTRDHAEHLVELWTALGDDARAVAAAAEAFPARWRWHLVEGDASVAEPGRDFV